ncbi:hypothetical protein ES703_13693 [subsurface metagenome]
MVKTVEDIHNFLDKLASKADLYVPLTKEGIASFEKLGESLFDLESYKNSVLPITKHLFPETETLYSYKWEDGYQLSQTTPDKEKKTFFGARPCTSVNLSPSGTVGMDILATKLEGKYVLEEVTDKGKELLLTLYPGVLREATGDEVKRIKEVHEESHKKVPRVDIDNTVMKFDSSIWEAESERCIGCGTCTFLCPTCHCFTIEHAGSIKKGKVIRSWDTCQFQAYTLEASGSNPRPNKEQRLRQRLYHKYKYFYDNFNEFLCVGCGRCINLCPVNIDVREIMLSFKNAEIAGA